MPERIQRKRTKGWRMPEGAVYVGRGSRWGNPWRVGDPHPIFGWPMKAFEVVALYRSAIEPHALLLLIVDGSPRGRDLACWCPLDQPCHADVLLEIANAEDPIEKGRRLASQREDLIARGVDPGVLEIPL